MNIVKLTLIAYFAAYKHLRGRRKAKLLVGKKSLNIFSKQPPRIWEFINAKKFYSEM